MVDPKMVIILILLGIGYEGYNTYVKPVVVKVEHAVKATGSKVKHVLGKLVPHGQSEGQ